MPLRSSILQRVCGQMTAAAQSRSALSQDSGKAIGFALSLIGRV